METQKAKPRAVSLHYPFKFSFPLHFSSSFKARLNVSQASLARFAGALRVSDLLIHVETFMQSDEENGSSEIQSHHRFYFPDHSMYTHRWVRAKIKSERVARSSYAWHVIFFGFPFHAFIACCKLMTSRSMCWYALAWIRLNSAIASLRYVFTRAPGDDVCVLDNSRCLNENLHETLLHPFEVFLSGGVDGWGWESEWNIFTRANCKDGEENVCFLLFLRSGKKNIFIAFDAFRSVPQIREQFYMICSFIALPWCRSHINFYDSLIVTRRRYI